MVSSVGAGRTRAVLWAAFGLALMVAVIDGGSCAIANVQVSDDSRAAARIAVQSVAGQPVNQATVRTAYDAATGALPSDTEHIVGDAPGQARDFRLHADGSVTLTVTRTAPTLLFQHLPRLRDLTLAEATYTQQPLGY